MAWDKRGYFYISRRVGRRVVRDYYGKGPIAEMAALLFARLRRNGPGLGVVVGLAEQVERAHWALGASVDPGGAPADAGCPPAPAPRPNRGGAPRSEPGTPTPGD